MSVLVDIQDLSVTFRGEVSDTQALKGVSLTIERGQVTALVGESGSGKSVTANALMRLLPANANLEGQIRFHTDEGAIDIANLSARDPALTRFRGDLISMVFQEPMTALSPVHTIGDQVAEAMLSHQKADHPQAWRRACDMLAAVGIPDPEAAMKSYPFQFSGGMRQRAVIAMALVCEPALLICDEPTTALDVTVQAEILVLIRQLHQTLGNAVLFITHDLGVVAQIADRVVVMYEGKVVETGDVRDILRAPRHAYTRKLIDAVPRL